jgi:hypothetical protein
MDLPGGLKVIIPAIWRVDNIGAKELGFKIMWDIVGY